MSNHHVTLPARERGNRSGSISGPDALGRCTLRITLPYRRPPQAPRRKRLVERHGAVLVRSAAVGIDAVPECARVRPMSGDVEMFIQRFAVSAKVRHAAAVAGIGERTGWRLLPRGDITARIDDARREHLEQVAAARLQVTAHAFERLEALLADDDIELRDPVPAIRVALGVDRNSASPSSRRRWSPCRPGRR
jgi:hypothetical protein